MNTYQDLAKSLYLFSAAFEKDVEKHGYSKSHKTWPNVWDFKRAVHSIRLKFTWGDYSHGREEIHQKCN